MSLITPIVLFLVGLLHVIPVIGVFGPEKLQMLYGQTFTEPNLELLMRHRAVLFGILGCYMIACAFLVDWRTFGLIAGLISVASFIVLASITSGPLNTEIEKVVRIDYVALVLLLVGLLLQTINSTKVN